VPRIVKDPDEPVIAGGDCVPSPQSMMPCGVAAVPRRSRLSRSPRRCKRACRARVRKALPRRSAPSCIARQIGALRGRRRAMADVARMIGDTIGEIRWHGDARDRSAVAVRVAEGARAAQRARRRRHPRSRARNRSAGACEHPEVAPTSGIARTSGTGGVGARLALAAHVNLAAVVRVARARVERPGLVTAVLHGGLAAVGRGRRVGAERRVGPSVASVRRARRCRGPRRSRSRLRHFRRRWRRTSRARYRLSGTGEHPTIVARRSARAPSTMPMTSGSRSFPALSVSSIHAASDAALG
jgi:hypothetical protein